MHPIDCRLYGECYLNTNTSVTRLFAQKCNGYIKIELDMGLNGIIYRHLELHTSKLKMAVFYFGGLKLSAEVSKMSRAFI